MSTVVNLAGWHSERRRAFLRVFPTIDSFTEHHPTPGPFHLVTEFPTIAVPVDEWSSTRLWSHWSSHLKELLAAEPDNPNYRNCLTCAETLLEWRDRLGPEDQFWDED